MKVSVSQVDRGE